jgi:hypothetical protein
MTEIFDFKDAAERFQEEAGISADMDLSLLDNRIKIRDYIQVFKFLFFIFMVKPKGNLLFKR